MSNSPFDNSNSKPLPDANDIEREFLGSQRQIDECYSGDNMSENSKQRFEADKRRLRNFLVGLLVTGLVIGGILAIGLVWVMGQLNLIEPTMLEQQRDR